jgi:protein-disulfide isomerase
VADEVVFGEVMNSTRETLKGVVSLLVALLALAVAWRLSTQPVHSRAGGNDDRLTSREALLARSAGLRVGSTSAAVLIVEFADFQCPACRTLHPRLLQLVEESHGRVALLFRHLPLAGHVYAQTAAAAAECASTVGHFRTMAAFLYAHQDSLFMVQWERLAESLGIREGDLFRRCFTHSATRARIEADVADALRLGAGGTPFLVIGKRKVLGAVSIDSLRALVADALGA